MAGLRRVALVGALITAGITLSSCGTGAGVSDARVACRYVAKALTLQHESTQPGVSPARRAALQKQALTEILLAQPSAAQATSADGSWNPLQTTIEEANRVPLQFEAPALTRLCQVANSSTPYVGA